MLNRELIDFIQEPLMIVLSVKDPRGRPAIARGLGAWAAPGGDRVDIVVSRAQWPDAAAGLAPGAAIAVTFCRPANYRAYQVKGTVAAQDPVDDREHALSRRYMAEARATLVGLGVADRQVDYWLTDRDLIRVSFTPSSVFSQTPGPDAGRAVVAAA